MKSVICYLLSVISFSLALCGCMSDKGSLQSGVILMLSTNGVGLGYGETMDVPQGCRLTREVYSAGSSLFGTNLTRTVTTWDTTAYWTQAAADTSASEDTRR